MNKIKRIHIICISVLIFVGLGCAEEQAPTLTLATYTYATNNRINNLRPLAQELEKALNRNIDVVSYPDVANFLDSIRAGKVDIGLINTLGYLVLATTSNNMQPIATLKVSRDAIDNYKTVLLSRKDAQVLDVKTLQENAKQLSMMFVKEGSTSGNLVPRLFLSSIGIRVPEKQFSTVLYGGNHTSTFEKLLKGEAGLCAIGSNEYFKQLKANPALKEEVNTIWISDEIPLGPVIISEKITPAEQEQLMTILLNLNQEAPDVLEAIKAGWSEAKQADKYYSIDDSYYDSFRKMNGNDTDMSLILNSISK